MHRILFSSHIVGAIAICFSCTISFPLVQANIDISQDYIDIGVRDGIMTGYDNGDLGLDNTITRAEITKVMIEATGKTLITETNCFDDIQNHWGAQYICTAQSLGIIKGVGNNFYPDTTVSTIEMYKIVLLSIGQDIEYTEDENWYIPFKNWLLQHNTIDAHLLVEKNPKRKDVLKTIIRSVIVTENENQKFQEDMIQKYKSTPLITKKTSSALTLSETEVKKEKEYTTYTPEDLFLDNTIYSFDAVFDIPLAYFGLSAATQYQMIPPNNSFYHDSNGKFLYLENKETELIDAHISPENDTLQLPISQNHSCFQPVLVDADQHITTLNESSGSPLCFHQFTSSLSDTDFVEIGEEKQYTLNNFDPTSLIHNKNSQLEFGIDIQVHNNPQTLDWVVKAPDGSIEKETHTITPSNTTFQYTQTLDQTGVYQAEILYYNDNGPNVLFNIPIYVGMKYSDILEGEAERQGYLRSTITPEDIPRQQWNMIQLLNEDRRHNGVQALQRNIQLERIAQIYAEKLAQREIITHKLDDSELLDRIEEIVWEENMYGQVFGENLSIDRNEILAQKHLYDSPGHFQNIVNPLFQEVGIGITVWKYKDQDVYYYVQVFSGENK